MRPHYSIPRLEHLENRNLLAVDLLAAHSAPGTLSSAPQDLVYSGRYTFFDARLGVSNERTILRTTVDVRGFVNFGPGDIDASVALADGIVYVSNGQLFGAIRRNAPVQLASRPDAGISGRPGELIRLSESNALWLLPENLDGTQEMYVTDGQTAERFGTPFANSSPVFLGVVGQRAVFTDNSIVWSTDGTERTFDGIGARFRSVFQYSSSSDSLYFEVENLPADGSQSGGRSIWRYKANGLVKLANLADYGISSVSDFYATDETLYFAAYRDEVGRELFKLDNSEVTLVADIVPGTKDSNPEQFFEIGEQTLFTANDSLYRLTDDGAELVRAFVTNAAGPHTFEPWNGEVYFAADGGEGVELWKTDGTTDGTKLVADIAPGSSGSFPTSLTAGSGGLTFAATTASVGTEFWTLDRSGNVNLVQDLRTEVNRVPRPVSKLVEFNGKTYFRYNDGLHGNELWSTDGTKAGTRLVKDIFPGSRGGSPRDFFVSSDVLYFTANDGKHGYELWKTDGTHDGTTMIADIWPGAENSVPTGFAERNGGLVFGAYGGLGNGGIWKSDGTPDGTEQVVAFDATSAQFFEPVARTIPVGDDTYVLSKDGYLGRVVEENVELQAKLFSAPFIIGDSIFADGFLTSNFATNPIRNRTGLLSIDATSNSVISQGLPGEEFAEEQTPVPFGEAVYFLRDGVIQRWEPGSSPRPSSDFPGATHLAASDTHLFAWTKSTGPSQVVYALNAAGESERIYSARGEDALRIDVDSKGLALVVEGRRDELDVWYSDGTLAGTQRTAILPPGTKVKSIDRTGNSLLVTVQPGDGNAETILSVPLLGRAGDFNGDDHIDGADVDALFEAIADRSLEVQFDLNGNGRTSSADTDVLIRDLAGTEYGDVNFDGDVNFTDFLVLSRNFGKSGGYADGDLSGDGEIQFRDFVLLSRTFGFRS